jgi:starch synthase
MRIAHLLRKYNPAEWGGTESVIQQLFDGLRREGVESVVYCPQLPDESRPNGRAAVADPLAATGCMVKRFNACVPIWGISDEQRRQMIAVGGNLMSFDLIRTLWAAHQDVIHSHALGRIGGIGLTVARRKKIPFVVTVHGGAYDLPDALRQSFKRPDAGRGFEWGKPFGLLLRSRHVLTEADAIITCNPREAELIARRHPDRRVVVQPHGVRAELYDVDHRAEARAAFPQIVGRTVLLSVGRIDPVKNQRFLIDQVPELARRHPGMLLVLAGACTDAAYGEEINQIIAQRDLSRHVLLTGKLPPSDPRLIGLMQEAKVALLQSISETFGLVILEAWAAGTPAVSSRTSGASTLIDHGRNGWLFDLDKSESFHHALNAALLNPAARERVVATARQRVVADFDTRVLAGRMKRLYEDLQEERHALRNHS